MPAPVPIQIRYGDTGVLGAAAAAGGSFQRQKSMDMQLISQMLQNKVQASLQEDQQAHEDQMSNDAFAMQRANQPPQQTFFQMSASDPSSVMKQMSLETAKAAGVEGPELAILQGAATNKNINAAYFESMTDEMKKRAATAKKTKDNTAEKQAYFNSLGSTLPPEEMTKLKSLADSGDMDLNQFRTSVGQSQSRVMEAAKQAEMEKKTIVQMSVSAVNDKINQSQAELKTMEKDMQDAREKAIAGRTRAYVGDGKSYDEALAAAQQETPAGTSEADFGTHAQPMGFWNGLNNYSPTDMVTGKPWPTEQVGGDPMGLQSFLAIKKKKLEIANLMQGRDQLISTLGVPSAAVGQKALTPALAQQFLSQAGGDKDKARQLAAQAGYAF